MRMFAFVAILVILSSAVYGWSNEESKLGQQMDERLCIQLEMDREETLVTTVNAVGKSLVSVSSDPSAEFHFRVFKDESLEAFSIPGGYVYASAGLCKALLNDDEFACVLGHEITHCLASHGARQAQREARADTLAPLISIADIYCYGAGSILAQLNLSRSSRIDEEESDNNTYALCDKAKYGMWGTLGTMALFNFQNLGNAGNMVIFAEHLNMSKRYHRRFQEIAEPVIEEAITWSNGSPTTVGLVMRVPGTITSVTCQAYIAGKKGVSLPQGNYDFYRDKKLVARGTWTPVRDNKNRPTIAGSITFTQGSVSEVVPGVIVIGTAK